MSEEWRPVEGFPGYFISDQGRVASDCRGARRILRASPVGRGYLKVHLCRGGHRIGRKVHHLVAEAFIGPRPDGMEVRHLDDVKTNNAASNLAHGSRSDNTLDSVRNGTHASARKTECPRRHPYNLENTYVHRGGRVCRTCRRERRINAALRAANVAA